MLKCYVGYSKIKPLYTHGQTGGCTTTLALTALNTSLVDGIIAARDLNPPATFVAHNLQDLVMACGSIYEEFQYVRIPGGWAKMGQIGKPCDINKAFKLKISLCCSHVSRPGLAKINKQNRAKVTRWRTPMKCWLCRDHTGIKADITVGDTQVHPKRNIIIARTGLGLELLNRSVNMGFLNVKEHSFQAIKQKQPYLFRGPSHGLL